MQKENTSNLLCISRTLFCIDLFGWLIFYFFFSLPASLVDIRIKNLEYAFREVS